MHGYLGAATRLANEPFHFDDSARHFWHLCLKKFSEESRVRAGEADECAANSLVDAQKQRAHALTLAVSLARDLLVVREDSRRATEIDKEVAALEALDVASDYLTFALAIFRDDGRSLRFADLLHDDLLRGLCGDATEIFVRLERK